MPVRTPRWQPSIARNTPRSKGRRYAPSRSARCDPPTAKLMPGRSALGLVALGATMCLGASYAAASPGASLHWRGHSRPQLGIITPTASAASSSAPRETPESNAVKRFKLVETAEHRHRVAQMTALGRRPLEAQQSDGETLWSGLGFPGFDELTAGGYYPADVSVGEGWGWVAEVANTGLSVWARTGGPVRRIPLGAIFNAPTADLTDPQIVYDHPSGHWFLSVLRFDQGQTYFAVSDSSDPTGGWGVYYFAFGARFCPDQPRLGVSTDVVALTVALFANPACHRNRAPELGGVVIAIDKAAMIAGAAAPGYQTFGPDPSYDNYQPALQLQPSTEQLFVSAQLPTSDTIHVIHFIGIPPNGAVTATNTFLVIPLSTPPNAAQRGSNVLVDTGDDRISSAVESNGVLYVEANDACVDSSNTLHACVRVMEVNTTTSTLTGEADLGEDNTDWYYGAVSPDSAGNLIAVFDHSSPSSYPGIGAIAALGPIQGENGGTFTDWTALATGTAPNESGRYGDYSGAALDWDNPADVWVGSEVGDDLGVDSSEWASHIDSVSLSETAVPAPGVHQVFYPGTTYRGQTRQRWRIQVQTGGGGARVERIRVGGIALRCQDHYSDSVSITITKTPAPAFGSSGRFRISERLASDPFAHWTRVKATGQINGNRIAGTVSAQESSRKHGICRSGGVRYTAR